MSIYIKNEELQKEFEIVQNNINKWDSYSLSIKNWAITIWSAIMVFTVSQYFTQIINNNKIDKVFLIPLLLPLPFWIFDGLAKHFQRLCLTRSNAIRDYLNESIFDIEDKKIKEIINKNDEFNLTEYKENWIKDYIIYDVMSVKSKEDSYYKHKYYRDTGFLRCMMVRINTFIYCILSILTLIIIGIITDYYEIMYWIILYGTIGIVSWVACIKSWI